MTEYSVLESVGKLMKKTVLVDGRLGLCYDIILLYCILAAFTKKHYLLFDNLAWKK